MRHHQQTTDQRITRPGGRKRALAANVFTDLSAYLPHGIAEVGRVFVVPTTRVLVPLGSVTHWDCKLSVARPSAYLGELELAERHAASRIARTGGWERSEMVRRYAHVSAEPLAPYANRLDSLRVPDLAHGTNLAQSENDVLP